jgi:hypothetical protein
MQTAFFVLIGVALVAMSFAFTLSCIDHGFGTTLLDIARYVDP